MDERKNEINNNSRKRHAPPDRVTYQMMLWLFMIGSLLGFLFEGIWHIMLVGFWESHPGTVFGPFCIIYGFGAVALYLVSFYLRDTHPVIRFLVFAIIGSVVEYVASWFQELAFGTVSWDYSGQLLNIQGRVSLRMAIIWGLLGSLFFKLFFPAFSYLICKTAGRGWSIATAIVTVLMAVNVAITACALMRWRSRHFDIPASNGVEEFIDEYFDDEFMKEKFPNMVFTVAQ